MNRIDYMSRLALLLSDIPEGEREEAIQYYNDYLNDAGVENEEEVLAELGTPEQLAASIKEGLREGSREEGEFSESGYREANAESGNKAAPQKYPGGTYERSTTGGGPQNGSQQQGGGRQDGYRRQSQRGQGSNLDGRYRKGKKKGMSGGMIALLVILGIITLPVTIPVIFSVGLVLFILAMVMIPLILVFLFVGVICIVAGVIALFSAFVDLFTFPAGAVLAIGMSLFTIGIGIFFTMGIGWILSRIFPKAFRKAADFCSSLFHKRGGNKA